MTTWHVTLFSSATSSPRPREEGAYDVTADACGILDGCLTFWNPGEVDAATYEEIENDEPDGVLVRAFAPGVWKDVAIIHAQT